MSQYSVESIGHGALVKVSSGSIEEDLATFLNDRAKHGLTLVSVLPVATGFTCVWAKAEAKPAK